MEFPREQYIHIVVLLLLLVVGSPENVLFCFVFRALLVKWVNPSLLRTPAFSCRIIYSSLIVFSYGSSWTPLLLSEVDIWYMVSSSMI